MFKEILLPAALALTFGTGAFAESYIIDTEGAHASVNFKVSHLGYSFVMGRFDSFSGSFEFDATNPEAGSVSVEIAVDSVATWLMGLDPEATPYLRAAVALLGAMSLSCIKRSYSVHHRVRPTCNAACDYYLACKQSDNNRVRSACVTECEDFFTDKDALTEFQRLECDAAVSFIEGPSGRPPGSVAQ